MENETKACQATREELVENWRKCWCPNCKSPAFFQDWSGWNWCIKHTWREIIINETWKSKWFELKNLKFRNPYKFPYPR